MFYDRARNMWSFNTGDCLVEVTAWVGLIIYIHVLKQTLKWGNLKCFCPIPVGMLDAYACRERYKIKVEGFIVDIKQLINPSYK
jgi:hypothetical protein